MIKQQLQNTPGYRDIPPKKIAYGVGLEQAGTLIKILMPLCVIVFSGMSVVVLPVAGIVLSGLFEQKDIGQLLNAEVLSTPSVMFALAVWPALIVIMLALMSRVKSIGLREQRRYYKLGKVTELSNEQRLALRLTAVDGFNDGAWTQTLEYWPCEVRVPDHMDRFKFFQVTSKNERRAMLDEWWGIVNTKQYQEMVESLYQGLHSSLLVDDMQSEHREAMVERIAGLAQLPETYVADCFETQQGKPPKLLWGFDLYRIIAIARSAYMSGYISEQESWSEILKVADIIHYLFDDYEDFYHNYRLGNAFWSNNFETAREKLERWQFFDKKCKWRVRKLAWPQPDEVDLPKSIRHACVNDDDTEEPRVGFI
ncbi:DUF1266 domain-containing protein [Arenicella xantha]|uniref:Uncharacterized protein DUF1266 n=1 Tax=Arenicella xantha TaxID=644221 RepID=A0A395JLV0_9GAMM|nr:DUF1266 domain-containing protein [Arenicella xantha]RBP49938.1 uncharacterized protein DUF1266 [Arenicella xantha]